MVRIHLPPAGSQQRTGRFLGKLDRLIAVRPLDPVILPLERDAGFVGCDQPAIGDGDAVGVAYPTYKRIARKPPTCEGVSPTNADDVLPPRRQGTSLCPSTA